ncbi:hypothetical protein LEMLEM_LOCUS26503 [Lemmus lemmus]
MKATQRQKDLLHQLVFSICWNPKEVGYNSGEGMDVLAKRGQAVKEEENLPSPMSLYRLPAEVVVQVRGVSSHLKVCIKGLSHPTSRILSNDCVLQPQDPDQWHVVFLPQDLDHRCVLHFWIVVHSSYNQVNSQE